jgi:hypothetical protein
VDITPESVQHAATNFATGQQHLADAWMRLEGGLDANAGMAGTGDPAEAFVAKYNPALKTIWKGFDAGIIHLGGTSKGLTQTANNHLKADHHSRADKHGSPIRYPFARVYPNMSMGEPGSAQGQGGSGLPGPLAKLWPNASVAGLNAAAAVWRNAAKEIRSIGEWLQWTIGTVTDINSGHDIDVMYGYFEKIWTPAGGGLLGELEDGCTAMGEACEEYAAKVDSARTKMKWELVAAGIGVTVTTAGGIILSAPTAGGSDAAAAAADNAEVAAILSPTAGELTTAVSTFVLSLLVGDWMSALTILVTTLPTITIIETEVEEELEPTIEGGIAITEGGAAAAAQKFGENLGAEVAPMRSGKTGAICDKITQQGMSQENAARAAEAASARAFGATAGQHTLEDGRTVILPAKDGKNSPVLIIDQNGHVSPGKADFDVDWSSGKFSVTNVRTQ